MGNKIITEKDFWICSCGAVPAQLQSQQESVKKKSGEKYITVMDKSTSSWIDFGCTRLMLIYAIIAAAVVVIAAMTVATGGAALIALGALAGLAGAAWGAIVGSLLCGQLAAKARKWQGSKNDYIIQQVHAISGAHKMTCPVGGTITFAPEIKNWSQAIALGASNYIGHLMEGMMAGAAIGMGGAALSGGAGAFASGGIRGLGQAALQFAKSAPLNVIKNIGATFGISAAGSSTTTVVTTAATAVGLRSLTATQAGLQHYGSTGESGWGAAGRGVFGMEEGMYQSGANILSGNAGWQDVAGLALLLSPVHKAPEELNAKKSESVQDGEPARDAENKKADEESVKDVNATPDETVKEQRDGEAYEADPLPDGNNVPDGIMKGNRPLSPEYSVLDNNGNLTEYGKWYYERPSGFRKGVRKKTFDAAKDEDGVVRDPDPNTKKEIGFDDQWDMGHKPKHEFRKHQIDAAKKTSSRKEFLDDHNNSDHYRPETQNTNRSHRLEDNTSDFE